MKRAILIIIILLIVLTGGVIIYSNFSKPQIADLEKCVKLAEQFPDYKEDVKTACEAEYKIQEEQEAFKHYLNAGSLWKSLGHLTESPVFFYRAIDVYKLAIERFEAKYTTNWNTASIYKHLQDYQNAEKYYLAAIEANNTEAEPIIALAHLYFYNLKKPVAEIDAFYQKYFKEQLIDKDKLLNDYALFLEESSQADKALEIYQDLATRYPKDYEEVIQILENQLK